MRTRQGLGAAVPTSHTPPRRSLPALQEDAVTLLSQENPWWSFQRAQCRVTYPDRPQHGDVRTDGKSNVKAHFAKEAF